MARPLAMAVAAAITLHGAGVAPVFARAAPNAAPLAPRPLLLRCGQAVRGELGPGTVQLYGLHQPHDRILIEAVDTSGKIDLLRLQARLTNAAVRETCSGVLPLNNATGTVAVSDCIPNLGKDQVGEFALVMSVVSDSPGNCGTPLPCGGRVGAALDKPGEVDAYTLVADIDRQVVTLRVLAATAAVFGLRLRVFDPDGFQLPGANSCGGLMTLTLPRRGAYTVLVSACARPLTVPYTISFEPRTCPPIIDVGSVIGSVDGIVPLRVYLRSADTAITHVENDISFDALAPIVSTRDGSPACRVNPDINKPDTTFVYRPPGCLPGDTCTAIRASVFARDNSDPIPQGSELYVCAIRIPPTAAVGELIPLSCPDAQVGTADVSTMPALCRAGAIEIRGPSCVGDCNDDGRVTIDEILRAVAIALGPAFVTQCPTLDRNLDGVATIDELLHAINNALTGCANVTLIPAAEALP